MFARPTVFVIGAGASCEFAMPLGEQLKNTIGFRVRFSGDVLADAFLNRIVGSLGKDRAIQLARLDPQLADAIPRFRSMDEVLHFLSDKPDIVYLGKLAISQEILIAERGSHLFSAMNGTSTYEQCDISWAGQFLDLAMSGRKLSDIDNLFKSVTVIDFNYDRVLPQYIHSALQRSFKLSSEEASKCVDGLTIYHPYGSIGPLDWEEADKGVEFGASTPDIGEIANRIRTYTEERDSSQLTNIRRAIDQAHVIAVFGFGFHKQNIELLDLGQGTGIGKHLFMTVLGIDEINHGTIHRRMYSAFSNLNDIKMSAASSSSFLRQVYPSLSIAIS
jgi:hypothetical protein